jgi:hypothetical protein
MKKMVIINENKLYIIERNKNESIEIFYQRSIFIIKNIDNKNELKNDIILLSKIWINLKTLNCKYNNKIIDRLSKLNYS